MAVSGITSSSRPINSPAWLSRLSLTANDAWSAGIGWLLAFGAFGVVLARGWVLWDIALHSLAIYALIRGARTRWTLLGVPVAVSAAWSADVDATLAAGLRVASLCLVGAFLGQRWSARGFTIGATGGMAIQAWVLPWQMFDGRASGIAGTISRLGAVGLGAWLIGLSAPGRWLKVAGLAIGTVTILASGARAPMLAAGASGILTGWRMVALAGVAAVLFVAVTQTQKGIGLRLTEDQLRTDAEMRLATTGLNHDPAIMELVCVAPRLVYGAGYQCSTSTPAFWGTGAHAYLAANPWPRPHNMYVLALHELGVLMILPAAAAVWAIRTGRIPWRLALVLGLYGLLDDALLSPAGYYVLALTLLPGLIAHAASRRPAGPGTAPLPL